MLTTRDYIEMALEIVFCIALPAIIAIGLFGLFFVTNVVRFI